MRRVVSLISIFISILALSFVLCLLGDVYPDEWICMGFLDIIFYMLLLFELEYERNTLQLSNNSRTDYLRFTFAFIICSIVCIISGFMPLYSRPVMMDSTTNSVRAGRRMLLWLTGDAWFSVAVVVDCVMVVGSPDLWVD